MTTTDNNSQQLTWEVLTWEQPTWEQLTWQLLTLYLFQEMASEALVAPVDGPQPPVDGQVPGPQGPVVEREICVICHDELDVHDTDNLMVLWCDHKFHKHCILEWRTVARRSERNCPFRCETSERLTQPLLALIH